MANQQKKDYVSDLYSKLQENPHFVLIGFEKTSHQRLEEFRGQLRELSENADEKPQVTVIKNSLFKVALEKIQKSGKELSEDDTKMINDLVTGQTILMLMSGDWMDGIKAVSKFAKEEDGMTFKAGLVEGIVYQESGLESLAKLPGKDELAVQIITALRSSQTRIAYSLKFNTMKVVNVLKNASEKEVN